MTDIMLRNEDQFWLHLDLDQLHDLPLENWRRICKRILPLEINEASRIRLLHWFPAAISDAEDAWILTEKSEAALRKDLKGLDKTERDVAREYNRNLMRETSNAKRKYKNLITRYDAFKTINNFLEE